ncbi:TPR-like protein [Backusella circina FSU 941]|nr:TPR-like protein [Backusella circina FSU 941]
MLRLGRAWRITRLYSTTSHYRPLVEQGKNAWTSYETSKRDDPQFLRTLQPSDFADLRGKLWKNAEWRFEENVLSVLEDMKQSGHAWDAREYNEYFMAKLFQAQHKAILDMYNGPFKQSHVKLSSGSFNVLLATYIQLGQIDQATALIKEAPEQHNVMPSIRDLERTMKRCLPTDKKVLETAKQLIAAHGFQNTTVLNTNLVHMFKDKRLDDVKAIIHQSNMDTWEVSTYSLVINGYVQARLMRDATEFYEHMAARQIAPDTYTCNNMLSIFAHARDVPSAENIIKKLILSGQHPDEGIYNQLIKVYFKCRQSQKAFLVFEEIQRNPKLQINDIILNTMVNGLVINKELPAARMLYQQMIRSKFKPDIITFNTMLKGYCRLGEMPAAAEIISDMHRSGLEPDTVTFTTLIDTIFERKHPATTAEMMKILKDIGMTPNIYTYNAVINGFIKQDKMEQAKQVLSVMKQAHIHPTIHTYTNLVQGHIERMDLASAMATYTEMTRHDIKPDRAMFNFIITGFLDHERLDDAVLCLERMREMKLSATKDTWRLVLEECIKKKDWAAGQKVVSLLDQSGFAIKSDSLRRVYTTVKKNTVHISLRD